MIFSDFTNKTKQYLKSLRYLKDYASFDLYLPGTWVIPKKYVDGIEVIKQDNTDRPNFSVYSFVVQNEVEKINQLETALDNVIKHNREREEKERLFKEKIQELKTIFETKDVDSLKTLYFDVNENTTLLLDDEEQIADGKSERTEGHDDVVQEREA